VIFFVISSFCAASLNALLTSFVLISLFGLLYVVNKRLSSVRFVLVLKYCLRYLTASPPIKSGRLLNLPFFILHGIGVSGSKILSKFLILSCFMVCGGSPDCLMTVKNAFSRGGRHCSVILLISSFSMSLFFIFLNSFEFGSIFRH